MTPRIYFLANVLFLAAVFVLPAWSVTAANLTAETGLLSPVGARHVFVLHWVNDMGVGFFNLLTLAGLLTIGNTLLATLSRLRSTPQGQ